MYIYIYTVICDIIGISRTEVMYFFGGLLLGSIPILRWFNRVQHTVSPSYSILPICASKTTTNSWNIAIKLPSFHPKYPNPIVFARKPYEFSLFFRRIHIFFSPQISVAPPQVSLQLRPEGIQPPFVAGAKLQSDPVASPWWFQY